MVSRRHLAAWFILSDDRTHLLAVPQEDLLSLKVGSVLHHLSIKRAIQVLRINSFTPNCLRRRPSDEVSRSKTKKLASFLERFLYKALFPSSEQHHASRDLPVDQPQSDGVAALSRPGRVRPQPERQRRARRADGTGAGPHVVTWTCSWESARLSVSSAGPGAALQRRSSGSSP